MTSGELRRPGGIVLPVFLAGRRRDARRQEQEEWQKSRVGSNHDELGTEKNHCVWPHPQHLHLRTHKQIRGIWRRKSR